MSALVLTACPYEGPPLSDPDPAAFDARLVGVWSSADSTDDSRDCSDPGSSFHILRFNAAEYLMATRESDCSMSYLRAYLTRMGDAQFLNMQTLTREKAARNALSEMASTPFLIARVEWKDGLLHLRLLDEDLGKLSPEELRRVLVTRLDDPAIYDDDGDNEPAVFRRRSR